MGLKCPAINNFTKILSKSPDYFSSRTDQLSCHSFYSFCRIVSNIVLVQLFTIVSDTACPPTETLVLNTKNHAIVCVPFFSHFEWHYLKKSLQSQYLQR